MKIAVLQSGAGRTKVDPYGRVHSPLTNLRAKARPALRIYGQELIEIDVSNAQPLLLGFIAAKLFAGDWSREEVKRLGSRGPICEACSHLPMEPWGAPIPADLLSFLDVCQSGGFYQEMAETWGLRRQTPREINDLKRLVFKRILFGRVRPGNRHWEAFRRRCPSVATALILIKQDDHGTSARACQRLESRLMIEGVVGRFASEYPDHPIQTIHDSVLVVPGDLEIAHEVILSEFAAIGLTPKLKVKAYAQ